MKSLLHKRRIAADMWRSAMASDTLLNSIGSVAEQDKSEQLALALNYTRGALEKHRPTKHINTEAYRQLRKNLEWLADMEHSQ